MSKVCLGSKNSCSLRSLPPTMCFRSSLHAPNSRPCHGQAELYDRYALHPGSPSASPACPPVNCCIPDRCGTNVVGLSASCGACSWDLCSTCLQELRSKQQGQQQRACRRAQDSSSTKQPFVWTCCSPECPSVTQQQPKQQRHSLQRLTGRQVSCGPGSAPLNLLLHLPQDVLHEQQHSVSAAAAAAGHQRQQAGSPLSPGQPSGGIKASLASLFKRLWEVAKVSTVWDMLAEVHGRLSLRLWHCVCDNLLQGQ